MDSIDITDLSVAQYNTILAALRFYQTNGQGNSENRDERIEDIATCGGECEALDDAGIDNLCVKINCC